MYGFCTVLINIYFSENGTEENFKTQLQKVTRFCKPKNAKTGSVIEQGCKITPPGGPLFFAILIFKDLDGWRKDILEGTKGLKLLSAHIEDECLFVISDGRSVPLSECKIEFY